MVPDNASELFVGGQILFRDWIDISKDMIPEERIRVEGRPYFDGDNSKFVDRRPADRLLDKIFRK